MDTLLCGGTGLYSQRSWGAETGALGQLRQEDLGKFEASLGNIVSSRPS